MPSIAWPSRFMRNWQGAFPLFQVKPTCSLTRYRKSGDWGKCINSARVDFDCDIYVIDSNAKLFSGDLATYLGGRYVEFVIYPFSFKEYMECKRLAGDNASIQEEFESYILMGECPSWQTSGAKGRNQCSIFGISIIPSA